jgi:opacity protein-like surface antigen
VNPPCAARCALRVLMVTLGLVAAGAAPALAGGKLELYGIRMEPNGQAAERYSRPGWGGGLQVVAPLPNVSNLLAGVGGLEVVNLLSQKTEYPDPVYALRVEQHTDQYYGRLFLGGEIGPHGSGMVRPHAGMNLALVLYGIGTDLVLIDDIEGTEIRRNLGSENEAAFGYDASFGVDFNFFDRMVVDVGARYLKSFGVPQQLSEGSVTIHPEYFQVYLGVGVSFGLMRDMDRAD